MNLFVKIYVNFPHDFVKHKLKLLFSHILCSLQLTFQYIENNYLLSNIKMAYEIYKNENMYIYIRFKMPFLCQGNHMTAKAHLCKNGYKKLVLCCQNCVLILCTMCYFCFHTKIERWQMLFLYPKHNFS